MLTEVIEGVYVGDCRDAEELHSIDEKAVVVTLAEPELDTTTDYHPLTDGKNNQSDFDDAVETVSKHLERDLPVVVHCRMGRSRSPTVLATAIAEVYEESFNEAIGRIHDTGRFINPHQKLIQSAREYLDEKPWYEKRKTERK